MDRSAIPYWDARSATWSIMEPLSPGAEDVAVYRRCAQHAAEQAGGPMHAMLLGVTAPVATLDWPAATRLLAVDWAEGMIRNVWSRHPVPHGSAAIRGDWRELPMATGSMHFAVGDGCYSTFANLEGPALMNAEVRRVLVAGGLFCIRSFRRPDTPEPIDALFERLLSGEIANLELFRWLLAQAVQGDSPEGVSLHEVWRAWKARVPDSRAHRERLGWPASSVANLERWESLESRYVFPSLAELQALAREHFVVEECVIPTYPWGERFPILVLRPR